MTKVAIRNYIPGEHLPWSREEIGYNARDFDPEYTWVVFVDREMMALLVGAKMLNSLMLIRLLSTGGAQFWLRPLWREVRRVCAQHGIEGFWTCMDNGREPERKLLTLLRQGRGTAAETLIREATGVWITGRF